MNWIGLYTFIRREVERTRRVMIQAVVTPLISALLYIFIFGYVVGSRIDLISGVSYIDFVLPGILMMNVIASAFSHSSASLYLHRFLRNIEELLVAPFSYTEMIIGYVIGGVARALIVGLGIFGIAVLFGAAHIEHIALLIFYIVSIAVIFSLLGILIGLWSNSFEQLGVLNTFLIMPLSFLGGIFYSVTMLPPQFRFFVYTNPFFYFIDGIRYSMIGIREGNTAVGFFIIAILISALSFIVWFLFKKGWRIRL